MNLTRDYEKVSNVKSIDTHTLTHTHIHHVELITGRVLPDDGARKVPKCREK